jgi:hypothetical protein
MTINRHDRAHGVAADLSEEKGYDIVARNLRRSLDAVYAGR